MKVLLLLAPVERKRKKSFMVFLFLELMSHPHLTLLPNVTSAMTMHHPANAWLSLDVSG
jgi:hypothetical protein